jgi:Uma2 family endonuclease
MGAALQSEQSWMPTLVTNIPESSPAPAPPRKRWTREQCAPLEASGLFEQERLELVVGELISKMGKNRPHVNASMLLLEWIQDTFGRRFVNAEAPIDVGPDDNPWSEPEPDLIVLKREYSNFKSGNPQPHDLALVIEISDSSLAFDLTTKARLYARAGIEEYWVLDVAGRRLIAHRSPVSGNYTSVVAYGENEMIAPLAAPVAGFRPAEALPG